jgi:hypothetical protein
LGIISVLAWIGITAVALYAIIYLVVGPKPDIWADLFILSLFINLVEALRNLVLIFTDNEWAMFIARLAVAVIVAVMLYVYAHLKLCLESKKEKLLIATIYPGVKLILYFIFTGAPK